MAVKDGKGWGIEYEDGHCTDYGWVAMEYAKIHNPEFCKKPTDVTWKGSPYVQELSSALLVQVVRKTYVEIVQKEQQ
jgi:hypothetical protein